MRNELIKQRVCQCVLLHVDWIDQWAECESVTSLCENLLAKVRRQASQHICEAITQVSHVTRFTCSIRRTYVRTIHQHTLLTRVVKSATYGCNKRVHRSRVKTVPTLRTYIRQQWQRYLCTCLHPEDHMPGRLGWIMHGLVPKSGP